MDFIRLETQLKERLNFPYSWGRKQSNVWDAKTSFIYSTYTFKKLLEITNGLDNDVKNYSYNRWFNFWSAIGVEKLFSLHDKVIPNVNKFDKLVDFSINGISFDHKTSVFPKGFNKTLEYAKENPQELIIWLYLNQSKDGRKHLKNRLFIIMNDKNNEHWKLKAEIQLIKTHVDIYVENFDQSKLISLNIENEKILSDIIWVDSLE